MTKAMPFLQKVILLSYDPRLFGRCLFLPRLSHLPVSPPFVIIRKNARQYSKEATDPMRSEQEIMDLILSVAKSDSRILAAYLKGSRTNPNVPKDVYQDFDLMYVVTETDSFRQTRHGWMSSVHGFCPRNRTMTLDTATGLGCAPTTSSSIPGFFCWKTETGSTWVWRR